jgi:ferrous iron transport protein B
MSIETKVVSRNIALVGNPNTGKTTVFNALTGLKQKIANYPGVTVEKVTGILNSGDGRKLVIHDLPGLYSLTPKSLDDKIAADVILGRSPDSQNIELILVVLDASNLERNLYLATQVAELGKPVVIALNMVDVANARGMHVETRRLAELLRAPVVPIVANKGTGIPELKQVLFETLDNPLFDARTSCPQVDSGVVDTLKPVRVWFARHTTLAEAARCSESVRVVSHDKSLQAWQNGKPDVHQDFAELQSLVLQARDILAQKSPWNTLEPRLRYQQVDEICRQTLKQSTDDAATYSEKADKILTHRILGPILFMMILGAIFQSVFAWAELPMEMIEAGIAWFGSQIATVFPDSLPLLRDLIVDGAIAGVGAILVFLPQILFLFFFLSLLEDTGYMARVAFIMDRFMRTIGLSGRSVIPLLSSFACAIPGIMATRTINNARDRLITIMIAPFMSCSARLPVYALMIGAFIPGVTIGFVKLPGLILLSMYLLGIFAAIISALVMQRMSGRTSRPATFVMELPPYRMPSLKWTALQMWERAKIFITDAGKIILAMSIVLWFLASFPKPSEEMTSGQAIRQSYAGQLGILIEPVIEPLGFNWKMGIGLITSFAAREVMVSTLATIYNVEGEEEDSVTLRQAMRQERNPETGALVYTPLVAISVMVFFVLACQCMSTVAIVKRETNSWRWPMTMIVYMTVLAYLGSLTVFQVGKLMGWG